MEGEDPQAQDLDVESLGRGVGRRGAFRSGQQGWVQEWAAGTCHVLWINGLEPAQAHMLRSVSEGLDSVVFTQKLLPKKVNCDFCLNVFACCLFVSVFALR